jgi:TP901 family phage tail tape measure protein
MVITANVQGLITNLHAAQNATANFAHQAGSYIDQNRANIDKATRSAALLGAGLVGAAAVAVKAFADWDSKMAQVQSLTHATASEMGKLRTASMQFAKDFGASASDAADAEIELVKAGVSVKDIMGGALKGALTLASAGQLDVADATSIAASAMTQFGLAGKDVTHIADLLSAGADKALGSVGDLGQGLKYVGPVAAALNIPIEQTVGVLSELAQNGILADQAGTSLRGMIQSLTSPSSIAAKTMAQYGIEVYNAQGAFVGLDGVAEQLRTKLGTLDQATRQQALGQIFGNEQITTATVLMKGGAAEVQKWTDAVDANGFAADQAGGKLNSLSGDLTKLRASIQNDLIGLGEGGNGPLRPLVQDVTNLTTAFGGLPGPIKQTALLITGGSGLAVLGVAGMVKLAVKIREVRAAAQAMNITLKGASLAAGGVGLAIAAGATALTIWANETAKAKQGTDDFKQALIETDGAITDATRSAVLDKLANDRQSTWEQLTEGGDGRSALEAAKNLGIASDIIVDAALDLPGASDRYAAAMQKANKAGKGSSTDVDVLNAVLERTQDAFAKGKKGADEYLDAQEDVGLTTQQTTQAVSDFTSKIQQAQQAQEQASDDLVKWAQGIADAGSSFVDISKNVDTAKASLQGWIKMVQDQIKAESQRDDNLAKIAKKGGSQALLDQLSKLGPEGAGRIKELAEGSKKNIDKLNGAFDSGQQHAQKLADYLDKKFGPKPTPIILSVDTAHAQAALDSIAEAADHTTAKVTVTGDDGPVKETLKGVKAAVDDTAGTITLKGDDGQALTTLHSYKTTVDQTTGHIIVSGTDAKGRQVVAEFTSWTDKQGAAIRVTADTSAFRSAMQQLYVPNVNVGVGVKVPGRADGGKISGPGGPTDDRVLIRASPGEFVVNARSYSRYGPLVDAINAGTLPGFAKGGKIPSKWHGHSLEYWQSRYASGSDYLRLKQAIKNDQASLREKEHYGKGNKKSRYVLRGIDRSVANSQLREDKKALTDANIARAFVKRYGSFASAIKARDTAKEKSAGLAETEKSARTDARRGNVIDAVTGGLDSALSAVDQIESESHDRNLTQRQRTAMYKAAKSAEPALTKLYKQADGLESKLDKASDHLADMKSLADSASSAIKGTFDLSKAYNASGTQHTDAAGNVWYDQATKGYTKAGILSTAKSQAAAASTFTSKLATLQKKLGTSPASVAIVQQALSIFGSDPEQGIAFLDAFLTMSTADLNSVKGSYDTIAKAGTSAGQSLTSADSIGGLTAATTAVNSLTASLDKVNGQIAKWGVTLTNAELSPYGLKLNSSGQVVKKALGGWVDGPGTSTSDSVRAMLSRGEFVVNAQAAKANAGLLEWINSRGATTILPASAAVVHSQAATTVSLEGARVVVQVGERQFDGYVVEVAGGVVSAHTAAQDRQAAYVGGGF